MNILTLSATAATAQPCEAWFPAQGKSIGVMIVSHGLNLRPEKMDDWAHFYSAQGFDVYRVAFFGHCQAQENYLDSSAQAWQADATRIYATAKVLADQKKLPLYLTAYSFSALVFEAGGFAFAKKVYLAPAFKTHFWFPILHFFASIFPHFSFSSLNLPDYRANDKSNFTSLLALAKLLPAVETPLPSSALLWIDPKDELVNADGLSQLADRKGWRLRHLSVDGGSAHKRIHHLIVDEASLGGSEWARVSAETLIYLREH